jgi:Tol biopolymer transport system component/DNA-binding winged helix-turn-helix (wHTH) protein
MSGASRPAYKFGPYRLDVAEQRLLHGGRVLPLTPKVFDVLRVLVENHGHLVEKERLIAEVWNDTFVEEGALSRSISVLRKTLGENGGESKYIETVPKRGYRFIAPVTAWIPGEELPAARPLFVTPTRFRLTRPWKAALVAAVLVVAVLVSAMFRRNTSDAPRLTRSVPVHRQVTFTGKEGSATLSPDGKRIAYVSYDTPDKRLIVQELGGGAPLTIFTAPEINYLRWSPDGTELLMWTRRGARGGVYVIPQLGGTPRVIAIDEYLSCWSPDGSTIAVAGYKGRIRFFDARARTEKPAATLRDGQWSVWDLDWAATGMLTFVTSDPQGRWAVWTLRSDGTDQRRLVDGDSEITTARWAHNGDAIYFFRRLDQTFSLLKIAVAADRDTHDASPMTVIAGLESDRSFTFSADGKRLVYARAPYYSNLWLVEANESGGQIKTRELTHGTFLVERPAVSPDGTSIVFNVGHEPSTRLHVMPLEGGPSKPITAFNAFSVGAVWSPDSKQIAFASTAGGQPRVWAVGIDGGDPHALSSTNMSDFFDLAWAPGSRILYQQSGNTNYYQLDAATRSETLLLSDSSKGWIFSPVYSPDGSRIAAQWIHPPQRGIWVIGTRDRQETLVYPTSTKSVMPIAWSADARYVYAIEGKNLNTRGLTPPQGETLEEAKIVRIPVNGDHVQTVSLPFEEIGGISMTPDGRRFVVTVYTSRSDVWVVDNFDP